MGKTPSLFNWLLLLAVALCFGGCASSPESEAPSEQDTFLDLISLETDEGLNCINRSAIKNTRIIGDRTIEFQMRGDKTYINILPHRCPGLRPGRTLVYETRQARLCSLDVIRILDPGIPGYRPTGSCGLGKFNEVIQAGVVLDDED
ncbi:MAG: hypothetical protein AAGI24_01980 [Pseudomonadota bacterium]